MLNFASAVNDVLGSAFAVSVVLDFALAVCSVLRFAFAAYDLFATTAMSGAFATNAITCIAFRVFGIV